MEVTPPHPPPPPRPYGSVGMCKPNFEVQKVPVLCRLS